MRRLTLACLLLLAPALAQAQPRHIYRDGNYFFCPHPFYDPYCQLPNDYSAALHPHSVQPIVPMPESRPGPPVLTGAGLAGFLAAEANKALAKAARPKYQPPPPQMSMEEEREYIIRQGEEHCRKYPQDTQVCHPPKP